MMDMNLAWSLSDPPLVTMHIMNCFLETRLEFIGVGPSYSEVLNVLPKIDGREISNEEFLSIKELARTGSSADATQTPDRNKSYNFQYGSKLQFTTTTVPTYDEDGRVKRTVIRRNIEIRDIHSHGHIFHDMYPINRDTLRPNNFISLEEVIALQCNLVSSKCEDSAVALSVGSKSVSEHGNIFEDISKQNSAEHNSAQEFHVYEPIRQNANELLEEIKAVADTYHSDSPFSSGQQSMDNQQSFSSANGYVYNEISSLSPTDTLDKSHKPDCLHDITPTNDRIDESTASDNNPQESNIYLQHIAHHNFAADEIHSVYDGPVGYKDFLVSKYMDLYFKCFIFPHPTNDGKVVTAELSMSGPFPKIQLYQHDRELMLWIYAERKQTKLFPRLDPPDCILEKLIYIAKEDFIPCGISATSRIPPNEKVNRSFHGDLLTDKGTSTYADSRTLILCVSNMAFYIIPTYMNRSNASAIGLRTFPSSIPISALFGDGLWAHAKVCHPLKFLRRITIGFRFQRISLHFSLPFLRDALYIDSGHSTESNCDYTYILLTRSKKRAVNFVQMILNASKHTGDSMESRVENYVQVNNDDAMVLENLAKLIPSATWDEGIRHYQMVHQRWQHGERSPVRRLIVLTNDKIFLLDEYYIGDGCCTSHGIPEYNDLSIGDPVMALVDSADVADIIDVSAAIEESRLITITIKTQMRLLRSHRWRIICDDSEGAEKLIDDIRKAMATRGRH